jgi:hypothetical protein
MLKMLRIISDCKRPKILGEKLFNLWRKKRSED